MPDNRLSMNDFSSINRFKNISTQNYDMDIPNPPMISIPLDEYYKLLKDSSALHGSPSYIESMSEEQYLSKVKMDINNFQILKELHDYFEKKDPD